MELMKWDPQQELEEISRRLNRVFRGGLTALTSGSPAEATAPARWVPTVDIQESEEEYLIKAELPEVKREDVKVNVKDHQLSLQGERKAEKEEKGKRFHRIERSYGSFYRSFTLPEGVDEAKLSAEFKDGMLCIHLPKSPAAKALSREIKVN